MSPVFNINHDEVKTEELWKLLSTYLGENKMRIIIIK